MTVRVITPPEPIVTPDQIAGPHAADDLTVAGVIAAVTAEIDGPDGWLGRSLGPQTLEWTRDGFGLSRVLALPCLPIIEIAHVFYLDAEGIEHEVADVDYRLSGDSLIFRSAFSFPSTICAPDAVRIRYRAGYDGVSREFAGTGDVPANAIRAVILSTQNLMAMGAENLFLRAEEVEGIGRTEYTVSETAGNIIRQAADRMLAGLRIYA